MKTIVSLIIFLCFFNMKPFAKNSDSSAFNKGEIVLSVGYGFPNIDKSYSTPGGSGSGSIYGISFIKTGYGPFHFRGEYGLTNKIGIGISINYDNYGGIIKKYPTGPTQYYTDEKRTSSFAGLIRCNYHFATCKKLDPYVAIGAGFRSIKNTFTTDDPNGSMVLYDKFTGSYIPSKIALEALAGIRYYFIPHISIYSEIGISQSLIQFGASVGF